MTGKAKIEVAPDGAVITATFDRKSPTLMADVEAFTQTLTKLQKTRGFSDFMRSIKEEGSKVIVKVIPSKPVHAPEDLAAMLGGEETESAGGFEKASRPSTPRATAPAEPLPPADEKLTADLKKALFIPRR